MPILPSPAEIRARRTANGGWTKLILAEWGVSWPPPKGWRRDLEQRWMKTQLNQGNKHMDISEEIITEILAVLAEQEERIAALEEKLKPAQPRDESD